MNRGDEHFVSLAGVTKSFGDLVVLRDIALTVDIHQVVCLIGASGSGKSTLLRCVNLLEKVEEGTIVVDGQTITDGAVDMNVLRRKIGIVFQAFNLFPHMTVMENITLAPRKTRGLSKAECKSQARDLLGRIGLLDKADEYPDRLSGGQQQRVAIARALAYNPAVLLMDEPFAALDALTRDDMQRLLADVWRETRKTIIYVTHNVAEAVYLADRVVVMTPHPGRVKTLVDIALPRPRDPLSVEFLEYQKALLNHLGQAAKTETSGHNGGRR